MRRFGPLALVTSGALAAVWSARFWPAVGAALPPCPFRTLTGVPCPTCGTTHAFLALAQGNLGAAFAANPLVVASVAVAALLAFLWAGASALGKTLPASVRELQTRWPLWLRVAVAGAILANWIWVVASS
ncbi:MAG: DUF2752 domain-containing protein [Thermoanaerobaculum sp.]